MAAPRRGCISCVLVYLTTLAPIEYAVITRLVQPMPSTRRDWQFATMFVAPMSAMLLLWFVVFIVRIVADVWTFLGYLGRLISGEH